MYLTHQKLINNSRNTIVVAQRVLNDREFAKSETRRIYKSCDLRGKVQHTQKYARLTLKRAAEFGLTVEKPYKIIRDDSEYITVIGMLGNMVVPMWHVPKKAVL